MVLPEDPSSCIFFIFFTHIGTGSKTHIFWFPSVNSELPSFYFPEKHPGTLMLITFFHMIASDCLVSLG